jgi:hypothetical protein
MDLSGGERSTFSALRTTGVSALEAAWTFAASQKFHGAEKPLHPPAMNEQKNSSRPQEVLIPNDRRLAKWLFASFFMGGDCSAISKKKKLY